jgi:hypothetical protein
VPRSTLLRYSGDSHGILEISKFSTPRDYFRLFILGRQYLIDSSGGGYATTIYTPNAKARLVRTATVGDRFSSSFIEGLPCHQ